MDKKAMSQDKNTDDTDRARRAAHILGHSCAAAKALERYEQIKAAGHDTHIILRGNVWLVKEPT